MRNVAWTLLILGLSSSNLNSATASSSSSSASSSATTTATSTSTSTTPTTTTTAETTTPQLQVAAPTFLPPPNSYVGSVQVQITSSTNGAAIYYSVDGTAVTPTTGTLYSGPVLLNFVGNTVLKAIASLPGLIDSTESIGTYVLAYSETTQCRPDVYANCTRYCKSSTTCSGHGSCSSLGTCVCDESYFGSSCAIYSAPQFVASASISSSTVGQLLISSTNERVDFPIGALPVTQTTVTAKGYAASLLPTTSTINATLLFLSNVIDLQPSPLTFNKAISLTLKYSTNLVTNSQNIRICYFNDRLGTWDIVGGGSAAFNGFVTTTILHFSKYASVEVLKFPSAVATPAPSPVSISGTTTAAPSISVTIATPASSTPSLSLGGFIGVAIAALAVVVFASLLLYNYMTRGRIGYRNSVVEMSPHKTFEIDSVFVPGARHIGHTHTHNSPPAFVYAPVGSYITPNGFAQNFPDTSDPAKQIRVTMSSRSKLSRIETANDETQAPDGLEIETVAAEMSRDIKRPVRPLKMVDLST